MSNLTETDRIFNDIRPYRDDEVEKILQKIINNEDFEKALLILMGKYLSFYKEDERKNLFSLFIEKLNHVKTVNDFQKEVVKYMLEPMIKGSIDSLTSSGIENLSKDEAYLYIGNHRDITLDPGLLNYALMSHGFETVEIAFGDNLLINEFVSHVIRINKSFIVKRNLPLIKQLDASIHLSKYIYCTITQKRSVWLAQREGRAKDGNDVTNPAVISMLYLSQRDGGLPLADFIKRIHLVPVAVSYEYDPCDRLKALEISKFRNTGQQEKGGTDDLISMNQGIAGYKGRVHYTVNEPLVMDVTNDRDVAKAIDRAIQLSYRLWPTNYLAFDELHNTKNYSSFYNDEDRNKFDERFKRFSPEMKFIVLEGYANPVKNHELQLGS